MSNVILPFFSCLLGLCCRMLGIGIWVNFYKFYKIFGGFLLNFKILRGYFVDFIIVKRTCKKITVKIQTFVTNKHIIDSGLFSFVYNNKILKFFTTIKKRTKPLS